MVSEFTPMDSTEGHISRWLWTSLPCSRCSRCSSCSRGADVEDRIRHAAATIYQALIDAELSSVIGAEPHERTGARLAQRNGHRPKTITTTAGDLELRIPKLRTGFSSRRCSRGGGGSISRCSRSSWRERDARRGARCGSLTAVSCGG